LLKRVILIVLDSVGIGELPDAKNYGDQGSNTLGNICRELNGLYIPTLQKLGIANIIPLKGISPSPSPIGSYGKMAEASPGKDTTTGHWELAGVILEHPFPTYPIGFPPEIIKKFEEKIGRKVIGNYPESGTVIINDLGKEHFETGSPIVYTSADSVFQIAAHEDIISREELYKICKVARELLQGKHGVGRVIARPFNGKEGNYYRTDGRKDFSLLPPKKTVLDILIENNIDVIGIGKIKDIFGGRGITNNISTSSNMDGLNKIIEVMEQQEKGLIFANLVEFDMVFGHRNDVSGYGKALEETDKRLADIITSLKSEDMLIVTADHGCDPTTSSTDHSREYVPLLVYGKRIRQGKNLGIRKTFADNGATISEIFGIPNTGFGQSFLSEILLEG
jgi:phosphopentomutase